MLDSEVVLCAVDCEEVEAHLIWKARMPQIGVSRPYHMGYLAAVDSFERVYIEVCTCLHFRKHQNLVAQGYDVDFKAAHMPVCIYYRVSLAHEELHSLALAPFALSVVPRHDAICAKRPV